MPDLLALMDLVVLFKSFALLYIFLFNEVHQSQQVRHSAQDMPSNVTSGTSVYKIEAIKWLVASQ
jgi:hypothetical protein